MAITADKTGPGTLKFGDVGSELEWAASVTNIEVAPDFDEGDKLVVLSGDTDSDFTESYTLKGKVLQSFDESSILVYAHVNANTEVPWTFKPNSSKDVGYKGTVVLRRIGAGGDVDKKNESDFEFTGVGMYQMTDSAGAPITAYPVVP